MTAAQRICRLDGFPMVLDLETARTAVDAGWPAVELYRCANGHSHRVWPAEVPKRRWHPGMRACAVCGGPLPPIKDRHADGSRKYHPGQCTRQAAWHRDRWRRAHPGQTFVLEVQRWYRGPCAPREPLPLLDPLAGRMPRDWVARWARVHGLESGVGAL